MDTGNSRPAVSSNNRFGDETKDETAMVVSSKMALPSPTLWHIYAGNGWICESAERKVRSNRFHGYAGNGGQRYRGEDKRRQVASKAFTYLNSVFQRPIYLRGTKNAGDDLIGKSCSSIKPEVESRTVSMLRNEPATRFTTNHGCSNSRRNFSRISVFKSIENDSASNLDVKMIFRFLARLC